MKRAIVISAIALILMGAIGCGSRDGSLAAVSTAPRSAITRATENSFSGDAKVIAARESTDGWISATVATGVDSDLARLRSFTPAVGGIHARPDTDPDSILISLSKTASYRKLWLAGTITTGVPAIDTLSTKYNVRSVRLVTDYTDSTLFQLSFADPMATAFIAPLYKKADSGILNVSTNGIAGDGDQITRSLVTGNYVYVFSHGWGDCLSGCINRHTWQFTLNADSSITVSESGSALP